MSDQEDFGDEQMDVDLLPASGDDDVSDDGDDSGDSDIDAEVQLYEKYAEILKSISTQSYVYDNYVQLVQVAHQLNDLDKIRESHELFSAQFPLAPEIWTKWLQIELSIATSEAEVKRLHGLFKRALGDYFSVSVGGLYSQFASKFSNPQEIWDEIISTYALDCMEGSTFFKDWRSYYTKLVPESPEKVQKLLEMYTHELSLPLAGIQEVYSEFCEFCDKNNLDVDWEKLNETYHKSKDNLYVLLKFEGDLVALDDKEHHKRASIYLEYIEKCKTFSNDRLVQILYERMVTACCLSSPSWLKYVKYLKNREVVPDETEKSQVFKQTPLDILNRALRNCTWSGDLYVEKIRFSEKLALPKADVTETAQQAFEATNNDVKGHLNVWLEYLSYIKRHTNFEDEKEVEVLRKTMELGQDSLGRRSADANGEFDQLCARIEYGPLKNGDQGYQHYDRFIKNFSNQNKATSWIDFAQLDLNSRGIDAARRIFRRAIKIKNIDDFDTVMSSWKSFEYTNGTSDQIRECHDVCERIIDNYNRSVAIKVSKAPKRKAETESESKITEKKQKTFEESKPKQAQKPFSKPVGQKKPEEKPQPAAVQEFGEKDDVSVFLSNLSFETTKEEILAALPELPIKNVTLIVAPGGLSKGYGYLELNNPSDIEKALKFDRRPINGRPVFISRLSREKNNRPAFKYSESREPTKIFIKGLPFDATKDELQIMFCSFGTIKDIRMVIKKDGKFKGMAYIDFETEKAANSAVETMNSFVLRDFTLSVAISNPPPKTDNPKPSSFRSSTFPGMRAPVPRGEAKPRLSFIPSSVQRNVVKPESSTATNGNSANKPSTSKSNDYFRQFLNKK